MIVEWVDPFIYSLLLFFGRDECENSTLRYKCGKVDLLASLGCKHHTRRESLFRTCIVHNFLIRRVGSSILSTRFLPSVWEIELPARSVEKKISERMYDRGLISWAPWQNLRLAWRATGAAKSAKTGIRGRISAKTRVTVTGSIKDFSDGYAKKRKRAHKAVTSQCATTSYACAPF